MVNEPSRGKFSDPNPIEVIWVILVLWFGAFLNTNITTQHVIDPFSHVCVQPYYFANLPTAIPLTYPSAPHARQRTVCLGLSSV